MSGGTVLVLVVAVVTVHDAITQQRLADAVAAAVVDGRGRRGAVVVIDRPARLWRTNGRRLELQLQFDDDGAFLTDVTRLRKQRMTRTVRKTNTNHR